MLLPNTFLIGVQKSASTSLYDWVSQHPDVCGNLGVKDLSFFVKDELYKKGLNYLSEMFLNTYNGEKIVFHGSVEYIFYKKGLLRIKKNIPDAKFILILRNPLDRLISAYNSWKKLQVEDENNILIASIDKRLERSSSDDYNIKSKLTYIDHGLYSRQLETLYSLFSILK